MKLLIIGATGPTGQQVVRQALEQGHELTVFARTPERVPEAGKVRVVKGSLPGDVAAFREACKGQDALVSALGVGKNFKPNGLMEKTLRAIVPVLESSGPRRVIWLSAFGVGESVREAPLLPRLFYTTLLKDVFADKLAGEKVLRASKLDWTLAYPVLLTNGKRTGVYRVGEKLKIKSIPLVSRADLADFMLKQVTDPSYRHKVVVQSY